MRRVTLTSIVALSSLAVSASAAAAAGVRAVLPSRPAGAGRASIAQAGPTAHVTGVIVTTGAYAFTIQTPGKAVGVINALTRAANRLQSANYPYVWGGGHGEAGVASVGEPGGSGFNGRRRGYDCSGSVAAVLSGAGLWPAGASVPNDAGVIAYLERVGEIAPGAGTGDQAVTLYDDPGVHIFMNISGRFFGTSDGGGGGDARGGPGWLNVGSDVTSPTFKRYHVLPQYLDAATTAGYTIGFEPSVALGLMEYPTGTDVTVTYRTTASGMLVAETVVPVGELTVTGTVQTIGPAGSTLTITTSNGTPATFSVPAGSLLAEQLASGQVAIGDSVSVGYLSPTPSTFNLIALTITAPAPPTTTTTTTTTTGPPTTGTTPTTTTVVAPPPTTTQPQSPTSP